MTAQEATRAAQEVPAVISGSVNLLRFTEALARAGIVGRFDRARGVLVIEPVGPVVAPCLHCGGTGLEEDARCEFCDGTGRDARVEPAKVGRLAGAALAAVLALTGCATCERHPVACTAAVAIIGTSIALSLRHTHGRAAGGCLGYYEEQGASAAQAAFDCR